MSDFRPCPNCGEQVSLYARACVCGWKIGPKKGEAVPYNHVCTWSYGGLSCRYPVGLFVEGSRQGLCIFHRQHSKGPMAAAVAEESQSFTRKEYNERAAREIYKGDPPSVVQLRKQLKRVMDGETVGILASRLLPEREPGADESEEEAQG